MKLNGKLRVFTLTLFAFALAAGTVVVADPPTPELEDPTLMIPGEIERTELEGMVTEVRSKEMQLILDEKIIQWSEGTQFLDVRGGLLKDALPEVGSRVRVIGVEILDGYLAITVQAL